jgi:hypothetical protein
MRETTLESLATLKPVARENGVHTAGSSSQISDGASAVLLMTAARADALGLRPIARIVDTCLVGSDPVLMLTGPIDAARHLEARTGLGVDDFDVIEINEAFAAVVLALSRSSGGPAVNPKRWCHRTSATCWRHRRGSPPRRCTTATHQRESCSSRWLRWRSRHGTIVERIWTGSGGCIVNTTGCPDAEGNTRTRLCRQIVTYAEGITGAVVI